MSTDQHFQATVGTRLEPILLLLAESVRILLNSRGLVDVYCEPLGQDNQPLT